MGFVANFVCFSAVQNFENRLRFDKVTDSLKVKTFLRHRVETAKNCQYYFNFQLPSVLWSERVKI